MVTHVRAGGKQESAGRRQARDIAWRAGFYPGQLRDAECNPPLPRARRRPRTGGEKCSGARSYAMEPLRRASRVQESDHNYGTPEGRTPRVSTDAEAVSQQLSAASTDRKTNRETAGGRQAPTARLSAWPKRGPGVPGAADPPPPWRIPAANQGRSGATSVHNCRGTTCRAPEACETCCGPPVAGVQDRCDPPRIVPGCERRPARRTGRGPLPTLLRP